MKKHIFCLLITIVLSILFCLNTFAQTPTTIKTPTNVTVDAYIRPEFSVPQLAEIEALAADWIADHDSDAERVAPASRTYNCHAYAWHIKDGGNTVWLNAHDDHDDDPEILKKYWFGISPTYTSASSTNGTVCFYGSCWQYYDNDWHNNCDHSAEVISSNLVESKWGPWPRYRHSPSDCPYESSNIQYYNIPVSGDDLVCTSKTYSTLNISNATYNWSSEKVSTSGTSYSTTAIKTSNGAGWIQTEISSPYSGTTVRTEKKNVWAGKPQIYAYGSHIVDVNTGMPVYDFCYGTHNDVEAVHPAGDAGITDWDWQVLYGQVYPYGMLDQYATIYPYDYQSFMLEIRACNTCGYSDWAHMYTNVVDCGRYLLVFTPNPTTGETTLTIETNSSEKTFDENAPWDMEVYTETHLLKTKQTSLRGQSAKIQTAGWKEGVYLVRVNYNGEVLTGKVLVKK